MDTTRGPCKAHRWEICGKRLLRRGSTVAVGETLVLAEGGGVVRRFWLAVVLLYAWHSFALGQVADQADFQPRIAGVTVGYGGLARNQRTKDDGDTPHIYFTGCAGNITAGKYNDGNHKNRRTLTDHILDAMTASEQNMQRRRLTSLRWAVEPVCLPPREDLAEESLKEYIKSANCGDSKAKSRAALMLTYLRRKDVPIPITCLHLNDDVGIVHLPGEAFIEYQILAQDIRPDAFVAVASYGDCGPGYITLERSFDEGGYEPTDAFVSGQSEKIMRDAVEKVSRPS